MSETIILGSRGSALARAQAEIIAAQLRVCKPDLTVETRLITTAGDKNIKAELAEIGGKGVFVKELEYALLDGRIDIAVHSMKDITTTLAEGLCLSGYRRAESVRDVLVYRERIPFDTIPAGAVIGTGSLRRRTLLSRLRPDLRIVAIRGNVDTRIRKVADGEVDGVLLSEAGLIRLNRTDAVSHAFDPAEFLPAPGQGVIALETRGADQRSRELCGLINDRRQQLITEAEYAFLVRIGFDCRLPVGVYTTLAADTLTMHGFYADPQLTWYHDARVSGTSADHEEIGRRLADQLLAAEGQPLQTEKN
jgi:hydroxymethylbilane synthase